VASVRSDVGPFAMVPEWLIDTPGLTPSAFMVYAVLALHADRNTGRAHPSRTKIAERIGASKATVDRALKLLSDIGAIEITPRFAAPSEDGTRRQTSNDYRIQFANPLGPVVRPPVITDDEGVGTVDGEPPVVTGDDPGTRTTTNGEPVELETTRAVARESPSLDAPKVVKVDGQDLPWNSLAVATQSGSKIDGSRMRRALDSIRADVWEMAIERAGPRLVEVVGQFPAEYEKAVADMITSVAEALRDDGPTLTWGPEGIARNFRRGMALVEERVDVDAIVAATRAGRAA
jgi:hypothetical protein